MAERVYKNFIWFGVAMLVVFLPLARGGARMWAIFPALFIAILLIFVWLIRREKIKGTPLDIPILIFAALAIISFIFSIYKHDSLYALFGLFTYIGLYYLIVNEFNHVMKKKLLLLVVCMGAALSIFGLLQYFNIVGRQWWLTKEFLSSTFVNHNHFAGYLELIIPAAIAVLFNNLLQKDGERHELKILGLVIVLVLMSAAFILTQSRGAWASLSVAIFIMLIIIARRQAADKKYIVILVMFLITAIAFMYYGKDIISQRMETMTNIEIGEDSLEWRLKIWGGTIKMIRDNPFAGVGIGDFTWAFQRYRPEGLNVQAVFAHNEYLNMAAEMGIIAPFIMLWIFFLIVKTGLTKGRRSYYAIGCATGILSLSLHGLVDFNFHIPANMLLFTIYAAIVMSPSHTGEERR